MYCFADGLKLPFEACAALLKQGMYYNGWTHGHYITNVFVFAADGTCIDCVLNVPGSVHDSQVADWTGGASTGTNLYTVGEPAQKVAIKSLL